MNLTRLMDNNMDDGRRFKMSKNALESGFVTVWYFKLNQASSNTHVSALPESTSFNLGY